LALERTIELARALQGCELLLLTIPRPTLPWQVHRPAAGIHREIADTVAALALSRARAAGIAARSRVEAGDTAEVVPRIAQEEGVDHIFLPEPGSTPMVRTLLPLVGLSTNSAANRIILRSGVPVTVVANDRARPTS